MVIIVSHEHDRHAIFMLEKLRTMGEEVILLDYGLFPTEWSASVVLENEKVETYIRVGSKRFSSSEVRSVYYRRAKEPGLKLSQQDPVQAYIKDESRAFLRALPEVMGVPWINTPSAIERAAAKPLQLAVAQRLGFIIPSTVIGNDPGVATDLVEALSPSDLVMKSVDMPYVKIDEEEVSRNLILYTSRLSQQEFSKHSLRVASCPIILQSLVEKQFDVRVTVVGEQVFSAAIFSDPGDRRVDWRHYDRRTWYQPHSLPREITHRCVGIVQEFHLALGCIDLGYTVDGRYVFFEMNPNGQWLASEMLAGLPISDSLSELLRR